MRPRRMTTSITEFICLTEDEILFFLSIRNTKMNHNECECCGIYAFISQFYMGSVDTKGHIRRKITQIRIRN